MLESVKRSKVFLEPNDACDPQRPRLRILACEFDCLLQKLLGFLDLSLRAKIGGYETKVGQRSIFSGPNGFLIYFERPLVNRHRICGPSLDVVFPTIADYLTVVGSRFAPPPELHPAESSQRRQPGPLG